MEVVVRDHTRILRTVLDTGASKDLESVVARREGDLAEVAQNSSGKWRSRSCPVAVGGRAEMPEHPIGVYGYGSGF